MHVSHAFGTVDHALAERLGQTIRGALLNALAPGQTLTSASALAGLPEFRTILAQHLSLNNGQMDEQTRRALLRTLNRTGSEFAALIAPYLRGGGLSARFASLAGGDADEHSDATSSTSSFHSDDAYLRSPAGRAMQRMAREHGLDWAVNRPDILRLGEDAVRLFARTNFRRESFEGLRGVGMQARDIARLVRRAEESGQDANELARTTQDSLRILGTTPQARQELLDAINTFHASPNDTAAWERLDRLLRRHETSPDSTPEQQEQARKQREAEERVRQAQTEAPARAEQEAAAAERARREEAERAAREAERAAAEEARRRLAALRGGGTPGPPDAPAPPPPVTGEQPPPTAPGPQRAEVVRPPPSSGPAPS
jgi:hypothetical protein